MPNLKYYNPQKSAILGRFSKTDRLLPEATARRWAVPPKYQTEAKPASNANTEKMEVSIPITEGSDATSTPGETGGVPNDPGGELSPETAKNIGRNISGVLGYSTVGNVAANILGGVGYAAPAAVGGMAVAKAGYDAITGAKTKDQALKDAIMGVAPVAGSLIGTAIAPGIGTIAGGLIGHYAPKLYDKMFGEKVPQTIEEQTPIGFSPIEAGPLPGPPTAKDIENVPPGYSIHAFEPIGPPTTSKNDSLGLGRSGVGMSSDPQATARDAGITGIGMSFGNPDWGGFMDSLNEDAGWSGGLSSGATSSGDNSNAGEGGWG